jgi:hypothetical protein
VPAAAARCPAKDGRGRNDTQLHEFWEVPGKPLRCRPARGGGGGEAHRGGLVAALGGPARQEVVVLGCKGGRQPLYATQARRLGISGPTEGLGRRATGRRRFARRSEAGVDSGGSGRGTWRGVEFKVPRDEAALERSEGGSSGRREPPRTSRRWGPSAGRRRRARRATSRHVAASARPCATIST